MANHWKEEQERIMGSRPIKSGDDPDYADQHGYLKSGWHKLHYAARHGHLDQVRSLLDSKTDVNINTRHPKVTRQYTPLSLAAWHARGLVEHVEQFRCCSTLRLLLERKADVNATNSTGETPLMVAAWHDGCFDCMKVLLNAKADATIRDDQNRSVRDCNQRRRGVNHTSTVLKILDEHLAIQEPPEAPPAPMPSNPSQVSVDCKNEPAH
jgi:ankyrin repeat protein